MWWNCLIPPDAEERIIYYRHASAVVTQTAYLTELGTLLGNSGTGSCARYAGIQHMH